MQPENDQLYPLTRLWRRLRALDWRDIMERAVWTAAEAFAPAWPAGLWLTDLSAWQAAGMAALMAFGGYLLAIVKNIAKQTRAQRVA